MIKNTNTMALDSIAPNQHQLRRRHLIALLCLCLPLSFILAIVFGTVNISFIDTINSLLNMLLHSTGQETVSGKTQLIIQHIRLPRALLAALIGAILGICGATTQGLFRNPLADPSLIGVTAGASAGAALMIFFANSLTTFNGLFGLSLVSVGAFVGGMLSVLLVYKLATTSRGTSVATMLLAGIAITAIAGGLTSLLEFFASNDMLRRISLWRMGGLDGANYARVAIAAVISLLVIGLLPKFSTALNALLLGESEARHLGISVQKIKIRLILLVAIGIGSAVALAGSIAFVGLVVPHTIRLLIGPNHNYLLPMSAVGGAILLLLADTLARSVFAPIELPVGLVTAFIGAPFFISLLNRRHQFGMR